MGGGVKANAVECLPACCESGDRRSFLRQGDLVQKGSCFTLAGAELGPSVRINGGVRFYGRGAIWIGEDTWIGPECRFYSHPSAPITIGHRCDIAPRVIFATGGHRIGGHHQHAGEGCAFPISVGDGCWVGIGSTLLGGVEGGDGCVNPWQVR